MKSKQKNIRTIGIANHKQNAFLSEHVLIEEKEGNNNL